MNSTTRQKPKVCVVTPVYNTARYLPECIESVLSQSYGDFEYVISDNASTDDSLAIARSYAEKDKRVRVLAFEDHLNQLENYNRAVNEIGNGVEYCKVVQADDLILKNCLADMVELAELEPNICIVGAYTILQNHVFLDGLDFQEYILDGTEICRRYLLDGPYIVGSPTTCLYRTSQFNEVDGPFSRDCVFWDTDTAFRVALRGKFGFVHQVLSVARVRSESLSAERESYNMDALTRRIMFERYGSEVLSSDERRLVGRRLLMRHRRILGQAALSLRGKDFWAFHRNALREVGKDYGVWDILSGALIVLVRSLLNIESLIRRRKR